MRYYRYGNNIMQQEIEVKERRLDQITGRFGELVIDEDTIYEIDEECLRCQQEQHP